MLRQAFWTNTIPVGSHRDVDFPGFRRSRQRNASPRYLPKSCRLMPKMVLVFGNRRNHGNRIRRDQVYGGKRLKTVAHLGRNGNPITNRLGFGDALPDPHMRSNTGSLLIFETGEDSG